MFGYIKFHYGIGPCSMYLSVPSGLNETVQATVYIDDGYTCVSFRFRAAHNKARSVFS